MNGASLGNVCSDNLSCDSCRQCNFKGWDRLSSWQLNWSSNHLPANMDCSLETPTAHPALGSRFGASWNEWNALLLFARRRWRRENDSSSNSLLHGVAIANAWSQLGRSWSRQRTSPPMWIMRLDAWGWLGWLVSMIARNVEMPLHVSIFRRDDWFLAGCGSCGTLYLWGFDGSNFPFESCHVCG